VESIRGITSIKPLCYYSTLSLSQETDFDQIDIKQMAQGTDVFVSNSKN
jgi:hypothetical protein